MRRAPYIRIDYGHLGPLCATTAALMNNCALFGRPFYSVIADDAAGNAIATHVDLPITPAPQQMDNKVPHTIILLSIVAIFGASAIYNRMRPPSG